MDTHGFFRKANDTHKRWIPAFAGMTERKGTAHFFATNYQHAHK